MKYLNKIIPNTTTIRGGLVRFSRSKLTIYVKYDLDNSTQLLSCWCLHCYIWFYNRSDGYRKPIRRSHTV